MTLEKLIEALERIVESDPSASRHEVDVYLRYGHGFGVRAKGGQIAGVEVNRTTRRVVLNSSIDVR